MKTPRWRSRLRAFVINIFCRHGPGGGDKVFDEGVTKSGVGVFRDACPFPWVLHGVSKESGKVVEAGSSRVEYPLPVGDASGHALCGGWRALLARLKMWRGSLGAVESMSFAFGQESVCGTSVAFGV